MMEHLESLSKEFEFFSECTDGKQMGNFKPEER